MLHGTVQHRPNTHAAGVEAGWKLRNVEAGAMATKVKAFDAVFAATACQQIYSRCRRGFRTETGVRTTVSHIHDKCTFREP